MGSCAQGPAHASTTGRLSLPQLPAPLPPPSLLPPAAARGSAAASSALRRAAAAHPTPTCFPPVAPCSSAVATVELKHRSNGVHTCAATCCDSTAVPACAHRPLIPLSTHAPGLGRHPGAARLQQTQRLQEAENWSGTQHGWEQHNLAQALRLEKQRPAAPAQQAQGEAHAAAHVQVQPEPRALRVASGPGQSERNFQGAADLPEASPPARIHLHRPRRSASPCRAATPGAWPPGCPAVCLRAGRGAGRGARCGIPNGGATEGNAEAGTSRCQARHNARGSAPPFLKVISSSVGSGRARVRMSSLQRSPSAAGMVRAAAMRRSWDAPASCAHMPQPGWLAHARAHAATVTLGWAASGLHPALRPTSPCAAAHPRRSQPPTCIGVFFQRPQTFRKVQHAIVPPSLLLLPARIENGGSSTSSVRSVCSAQADESEVQGER